MRSMAVAYLVVRSALCATYPNLGCRLQPFSRPTAPYLNPERFFAGGSKVIRPRRKQPTGTNVHIFAASAHDTAVNSRLKEFDGSSGHHMPGKRMNWESSA